MHHEKSDELIVAMIVEPVIHRTCAAGCRGRLCEDKTQLNENPFYIWIFYALILWNVGSKGVLALERVRGFSMITQSDNKKNCQKSTLSKNKVDKNAIWMMK